MDEPKDYIALAVPVFFILIGVELLIQKLGKSDLYRFNDAITNISCGIGQQVLGVFVKMGLLSAYIWIESNYALTHISTTSVWSWVVLLFGVDFFYYWFHRMAHEISFFWGGHIVHHQSEEYNLSVALRQGAFQAFFSWVFYLPLAWIGFSWWQFVIVNQFQTLYQFWIHTRAIGKLPRWFEAIMNTPSHHRVHHGVNPKYIDKNHAGTFIIWDRLFGTFQKEEEEVVYGITKPLKSWNPVWANFDYFKDLFGVLFRVRSIGDFFRVLFKGPGWRPEYLGGPMKPMPVTPKSFTKFEVKISPALNYYVLTQYVFALGGASAFLFGAKHLDMNWRIGFGVLIAVSIMSLGTLLEARSWAPWLEALRLFTTAAVVVVFLQGHPLQVMISAGLAAFSLLSVAALFRLSKQNNSHLTI
jgi:alkylglycerol monooxygenase